MTLSLTKYQQSLTFNRRHQNQTVSLSVLYMVAGAEAVGEPKLIRHTIGIR